MRKIVIIGAGALGKCMAGILSKQTSIIMCERNSKSRQQISKNGLIIKEGNGTRKVNIQTVATISQLQSHKIDLLIFATKIMDLRRAVEEAVGLNPRYVFLPQNGIFDFNFVNRIFRNGHICRGVTTMACEEKDRGEVELFYHGRMYVGGDGARYISKLFRNAGIEAKAYRNPDGPIWAKLIFSAVMNPLPILTGKGYDVLRNDTEVWKLVKKAVEEGRMVARVVGVRLAFDPMLLIDMVRIGDLAGIKHRGSIVHDLSSGRSTELRYITGKIVNLAHRVGVKIPALEYILAKAEKAGA